jgi:hypothetical protein
LIGEGEDEGENFSKFNIHYLQPTIFTWEEKQLNFDEHKNE